MNGGIFTEYISLRREYEIVCKKIVDLQKIIASYPEGELLCAKNGNTVKCYNGRGRNRIYLPKSQRGYAEQLAQKKYYQYCLQESLEEKKLLESSMRKKNRIEEKSKQLLEDSSAYSKLLKPYFSSFSDAQQQWLSETYEQNKNYPEQLTCDVKAGHKVRSKSEMTIADELYLNHIPYRYECALTLDGITFYPDFTIMHPITQKIYFWEHFGMMDMKEYVRNTYKKLNIYGQNNIIPSVQLIVTFETKQNPIDSVHVHDVVEQYFFR